VSQSRPDSPHSLGEIVSGIAGDVQDLVRGEIALARSELDQKFNRLIMAAIWVLGGAFVCFAGLVLVLEGVAAVLAPAIPAWAALLIVGVVVIIVGGVFAKSGIGMISLASLTPDKTTASLQKDAQMLKEHT
jgi:uncharacterized membrane protein YqjE